MFINTTTASLYENWILQHPLQRKWLLPLTSVFWRNSLDPFLHASQWWYWWCLPLADFSRADLVGVALHAKVPLGAHRTFPYSMDEIVQPSSNKLLNFVMELNTVFSIMIVIVMIETIFSSIIVLGPHFRRPWELLLDFHEHLSPWGI